MQFNSTTPLLSILIPTLVRREDRFLRLLTGLTFQIESSHAPVEVVALQNSGARPIAEYREILLHDARGKYLCFIDDDDEVPDYYIDELMKALIQDPDVVAFEVFCAGIAASRTLTGLKYSGMTRAPIVTGNSLAYVRAYIHMQPIRTEIARQSSFISPSEAGFAREDYQFTETVAPSLLARGSHEIYIDKVMYRYLCQITGENTTDGRQPADFVAAGINHPRPVISNDYFRWCDVQILPGGQIA